MAYVDLDMHRRKCGTSTQCLLMFDELHDFIMNLPGVQVIPVGGYYKYWYYDKGFLAVYVNKHKFRLDIIPVDENLFSQLNVKWKQKPPTEHKGAFEYEVYLDVSEIEKAKKIGMAAYSSVI